jgi:hypothetical protein
MFVFIGSNFNFNMIQAQKHPNWSKFDLTAKKAKYFCDGFSFFEF